MVVATDKRLRPIPYPAGSERRRRFIASELAWGWSGNYREAQAKAVAANLRARNTPLRGERCGAKTRRGTKCLCMALANGRCRLHGGLSTGPRTPEGKQRAAANLRR